MDAEFEFDLREVSGRICDLVRNQKRGDTDDSTCVPMTCIELIQSAVAKREDIVAPALSVQQLISGTYVRDTAFGTTSDYLRYAKFNRITTEANYPYTGPKYVQTRHGRSAVYDNYHVKQNLAMLEPRYNISRIIKSIPQNGIIDHIRNNELPVSLAYACQSSWLNWKTWDVYSAPPREQCDARHDVTAIGYGNKGGQPYLIIKNSYGEEWGKNGYGRIALKFADNVNPYSAE